MLVPVAQRGAKLLVNGVVTEYTRAERDTRAKITLSRAGHYEIHSQQP